VKTKTIFACQECGAQSQKWLGRCPECGAWNSLVEERATESSAPASDVVKRYSLATTANSIGCSAAASCRDRSC
jgi:predicted ATP-dependent serine protease